MLNAAIKNAAAVANPPAQLPQAANQFAVTSLGVRAHFEQRETNEGEQQERTHDE
jgi:hypothetical protein